MVLPVVSVQTQNSDPPSRRQSLNMPHGHCGNGRVDARPALATGEVGAQRENENEKEKHCVKRSNTADNLSLLAMARKYRLKQPQIIYYIEPLEQIILGALWHLPAMELTPCLTA